MKKIIICCIVLFLGIFVSGCSNDNIKEENNISPTIKNNDNKYNISILSPIVMSQAYLENVDLYIQIVLDEGSYHYDYLTAQQSFWDGKYYIKVFKSSPINESLISSTLIKFDSNDVISFSGEFKLILDDYNNDGNMDFTLGQRFGSNGSLYQIYTVNADGAASILPIEDVNGTNALFMASSLASEQLLKTGDASFKYEYYDQSKGHNVTVKRIWDGNMFKIK